MSKIINTYQEHLDHVEGAKYDDVRERYASEIRSMANEGIYDRETESEEDRKLRLRPTWNGIQIAATDPDDESPF